MTQEIEVTLRTIAATLETSPDLTDKYTAAVLFTLLGCYAAGNDSGIQHIAETAFDEARAYVTMFGGQP